MTPEESDRRERQREDRAGADLLRQLLRDHTCRPDCGDLERPVPPRAYTEGILDGAQRIIDRGAPGPGEALSAAAALLLTKVRDLQGKTPQGWLIELLLLEDLVCEVGIGGWRDMSRAEYVAALERLRDGAGGAS